MNSPTKLTLKVFGLLGAATALWWVVSSTDTPQAQQPQVQAQQSEAQQPAPSSNEPSMLTISNFDNPSAAEQWRNVDDTVMGGVSQSIFSVTPDGYGLFSGTLSLENNGGFTSVRHSVDEATLVGTEAIVLRVKGDGRTYQFRLRMNGSSRDISYRSEFETSDEWQTVRLPIENFEPVFRGEIVEDAPELEASKVQQIGFLLASKDSGRFRLEVDRIQAER